MVFVSSSTLNQGRLPPADADLDGDAWRALAFAGRTTAKSRGPPPAYCDSKLAQALGCQVRNCVADTTTTTGQSVIFVAEIAEFVNAGVGFGCYWWCCSC